MNAFYAHKAPDAIWWEFVTGPSRLVAETALHLSEGKSVCVRAADGIPFRGTFFQSVADALRATDNSLLFDEAIEADVDPGAYLSESFGIQANYRPHIPYADFLKSSGVLKNRLIPVVASGDMADRWVRFIRSLKSASLSDGLFLLESGQELPASAFAASASKTICVLDYAGFITEYDALVFAGMIAEDDGQSVAAKRYIAALAVSLHGKNAENTADFIAGYSIGQNPAVILPDIEFQDEELAYRLWNAQVQELFPLVTRKTHEFIKAWREQIDDAFAYIQESRGYQNSLFPLGLTDSHGEPVNSPEEMELAVISYLARKRRRDSAGNETAEYVLYISDDGARERLKLLYEARNNLAHGKACPTPDIERLLRL